MKKITTIFLLLSVLSISCQPVTEKEKQEPNSKGNVENRIKNQIKNDLNHYIESLNNKQFDELVELIYPKLFGVKSKKDFKTDLIKQNIFGVYKEINRFKIESISPVYSHKNENYVQIFCTGNVKLNVSGEALQTIERIKMELELSYDTSDAQIENNSIVIKDAYFSFIALSKKGSNFLWKYIEVDKQKEPFYDRIIPTEILDQF